MLCRCPVPSPPGCPCCVCPGGGCFLLPFRFGPFLKAEGNRLDVPDCSMNSSQAPQTMLHWRDKRFPSAFRNGSKSSKASENTRSPGQTQQGRPGGDGTGQRRSHKAVRLPRNCPLPKFLTFFLMKRKLFCSPGSLTDVKGRKQDF